MTAKKKKINILAAVLFSSSLLLASCGSEEYGENTEMPPESTEDAQKTGVDISGDQPGTGADSSHINDVLAGDSTLQN
ncbi:hypothetical protein [Pontibacter sp. H249]|uniref:hypothetical protein n=1 Tax=Pontibacter sp. H249 TaxID=3133420 RepID=UPI0030BD6B75